MARSSAPSLTRDPIRSLLVRLTTPMVWGLLALMGFNIADTWFVAQLGARQLAAMTFTFPVVLTLTSVGIGLMAGTSSVIARRIGGGDLTSARRLATAALLFAFVLSVVFAVAGLATIDPLFRLLGAGEDTLAPIEQYMSIWYLGLPLVLVPMAGVGAIRATGDSSGQSLVLVAASLANLVLDPLLIFGLAGLPRLEIEGAAIASVAARGLSVGVAFYMLHVRHGLLDLRVPGARELCGSINAVLHVALPAAGTNAIIPLAMGAVTAMVAAHGADAVAGFGAAFRTQSVALIVFFAMSSMIGPVVGQNLGARQAARAHEAMAISIRFCLAFGIALAAALALAAPAIAAWFSDQPAVRETTVSFLRITPWSYGAIDIVMVINAAFNGAGRPLAATGVSLVRIVMLYLPLAFIGGRMAGIIGIFAGLTIADLGGGAAAWLWWRRAWPRLSAHHGGALAGAAS